MVCEIDQARRRSRYVFSSAPVGAAGTREGRKRAAEMPHLLRCCHSVQMYIDSPISCLFIDINRDINRYDDGDYDGYSIYLPVGLLKMRMCTQKVFVGECRVHKHM